MRSLLKKRINRATYWASLGGVFALYAIINVLIPTRLHISEALLMYICIPRLHDFDKSGWLVLIALGFEIGVAILAFSFLPKNIALAIMGLAVIIILMMLIWLGIIPGQPHANRFGEPPAPGVDFKPKQKPKPGPVKD